MLQEVILSQPRNFKLYSTHDPEEYQMNGGKKIKHNYTLSKELKITI